MAKSVIPEGKKRYSILLTEENFQFLENLVVKIGKQPRSMISVTIDEMIGEMKEAVSPIIDKFEKTGQEPTMKDYFAMLGGALQKIGSDEPNLIK